MNQYRGTCEYRGRGEHRGPGGYRGRGMGEYRGRDEHRGMKRKADVLTERPREISIVEYAQSRASEIEALSASISGKTGNKLIFQLLPRNLRRRAMSHNIKRLPKRLQGIAQPEYQNRTHTSKPPSRKHRRRPKNLLEEYIRRQRKHVWLETHIWHAKRFKMEDRWGYRIPLHSTDKSIKASYRATQNHCQIQDISYMCCIEVCGKEKMILDGLGHLTNPKTGLTFGAKANINGTREGTTMVYKCDKYPYDAIGCVSYLWKPLTNEKDSENSSRRQMWIWCHPSCYNEFWDELKIIFKPDDESDKISDITKPRTFNSGEITVTSLKDVLNRHRLTGPAANQIVYKLLQPANILKKESDSHWWQTYYQCPTVSLAFTQQGEFIESLYKTSSPGEYTPHSVIGITVGDPRITRPEKRIKVTQNVQDLETDMTIYSDKLVPDISLSALWYSDIRDEVKSTKMSDQKLNELKSDILIPGSLPDLGLEESRIPVILVQRPGVQQGTSIKYGCGWDIILPQNWSKAFWLSSIYCGARAAGVRELESLALEQRLSYFPNDYPDTGAGRMHEENETEKLKTKYDKRPPAKRCNYVKLGISSPFSYPWEELIKEWNIGISSSKQKKMYVLRDKRALKVIRQMLDRKDLSVKKKLSLGTNTKTVVDESIVSEHCCSLVHVEIVMLSRGVPDKHGIICIPTADDLAKLEQDKTFSGPREPVHIDLESRKMKKKKLKQTKSDMTTGLGCEKSVEKTGLRQSCGRDIIGFVNHGGFSFSSGNGNGLGFCSLVGLQDLLKQSSGKVLVRNPTSYQYRFAYLSVL